MRRLATAGLLAALVTGFINGPVNAAGQGLAVSPAFQNLTIKTTDASVDYRLQLTNNTTLPQEFTLSAVDFGSLDETGGVAFLGRPASELEHKYGLAWWMKLERERVTVAPGATVPVNVRIENRQGLAPGGHYGAVLATAITDTRGGGSRVGVRQVLSSLVLAVKEGAALPALRLVSQSSDGTWIKLPERINYRFQATGSVHVMPRGVVEVRDPFGRLVRRGALNEGSGAILPGAYRRYDTPLTITARAWWPGRYSVKTSYRFDGTAEFKTASVSVWYGGSPLVWGGLALILGLIAAGFWLVLRRRSGLRK